MSRMKPLALDTSGLSLQGMEQCGKELTDLQKSVNWWIGDLAIAAKAMLGADNYSQAFPPDSSPGLIQRCEAVARAYRESDRNPLATWTTHMTHANKPDRIALVAASVDAGRTSDEERAAAKVGDGTNRPRWLLAVDVSLFLHRFWFSGAGVEAASGVASWVKRTVERLREKGLTDCACCLDSATNHRKLLTAEWEDKYKDRPPRDPELSNQLKLVQELLRGEGFACVGVDGMEADDVMASYAKQFPGKVALLTQDKDCKQCLSGERVVMLLDVTWNQDDHSGEMLPEYHWYTEKPHPRIKCRNLLDDTGLTPQTFPDFQCLRGDPTDGIKGCCGVGEKGAADLVQTFGSAEGAISAAKLGDPRIRESKRLALIEFEQKLSVTRQLVTLRTDLELPTTTKI